jgi:hypothetical protein
MIQRPHDSINVYGLETGAIQATSTEQEKVYYFEEK